LNKGKKALLIISVVLLLGALVFVSIVLFQVREVAVMGCNTLDAEYVVQISGLKYGQNIFLLDKQEILDVLSNEPHIKPVSIEVTYPDRVIITVEERTPAAYIEKNGALLVIDDEGWLLEVLMEPEGTERPLITGLQADAFEVGRRLTSGDIFRVDVMSRVLNAAKAGGISLDSMDLTLAADIVIVTDMGLTVELGDDANLDSKISLLNLFVNEMGDMGMDDGILNVSALTKAYYRKKSD
jgi:cell division septal protein FtsQ